MDPRTAVTGCLVRQAKRFPELDLAPVDTTGLSVRDAALARAIDHAVRRRWLTLAAIVDHVLDQDWHRLEAHVQAPLLTGACQLLLLDRIPEHAAINEAVSWTKQHARVKAGGLVNAVLRRVAALREMIVETHDPQRRDEVPLPDGRAWRLREAVFAEDHVERVAVLASIPADAVRRWCAHHGEAEALLMARHAIVQPPIIMTGEADEVLAKTPGLTPHDWPGFWVFSGPHEHLLHLLESHQGLRVQDPSASDAIAATRQQHPKLIIDLCAGRGTKTRQLAALHPDATIVATDTNAERLETLKATFSGHPGLRVIPHETVRQYDGQADLLVLDVPCSNSGVLARRVEARYRLAPPSIESLVAVQRQLLADSIPLLAPSGRMLYTTCSIESDENEQQAEWLTRWHRMRVNVAVARLPKGLPGERPEAYFDGGYFALLEA